MIKRGDKERSLLAKLSPRRRKNKSQSSRSPGIGNGGGGGNGSRQPPAGKGMASAGSSGGGGGSSVESMAEDAPTIPQTPGMMPYTIPTRYLVGCGMDLKEAARRWGITWQWRKDKDIDGLLSGPCRTARRPSGCGTTTSIDERSTTLWSRTNQVCTYNPSVHAFVISVSKRGHDDELMQLTQPTNELRTCAYDIYRAVHNSDSFTLSYIHSQGSSFGTTRSTRRGCRS